MPLLEAYKSDIRAVAIKMMHPLNNNSIIALVRFFQLEKTTTVQSEVIHGHWPRGGGPIAPGVGKCVGKVFEGIPRYNYRSTSGYKLPE